MSLIVTRVVKDKDGNIIRQKVDPTTGQPDPQKPKYISIYVTPEKGLENDTTDGIIVNIMQSANTAADGTREWSWGRVNPEIWKERVGAVIPGCIIPLSAEDKEIVPRKFLDRRGNWRWAIHRDLVVLGADAPTPAQIERARRIAGLQRPNPVAWENEMKKMRDEMTAAPLPSVTLQPKAVNAPDEMEAPIKVPRTDVVSPQPHQG